MGIANNTKIEAAIKMLQEQGHSVQTQMRGKKDTVWFEIDRRMLASWEEMENLADGVYSLVYFTYWHEKRRRKSASLRNRLIASVDLEISVQNLFEPWLKALGLKQAHA